MAKGKAPTKKASAALQKRSDRLKKQNDELRAKRPDLKRGITLDELQNGYWVDEIKQALKNAGISYSGKKAVLMKRLHDWLNKGLKPAAKAPKRKATTAKKGKKGANKADGKKDAKADANKADTTKAAAAQK